MECPMAASSWKLCRRKPLPPNCRRWRYPQTTSGLSVAPPSLQNRAKTAVDVDRRAGDIGGRVGGEEAGHVGELLRLADPAQRHARRLRLQERVVVRVRGLLRSEEHTSALQSLMRISYAVFCLKKK